VSISRLVTLTARPIPHQKRQSAESSHHTTNGYEEEEIFYMFRPDRPLSVRVSW